MPHVARGEDEGHPLQIIQLPALSLDLESVAKFCTIHANTHDRINCRASSGFPNCTEGVLFEASGDVRAQLNVGADQTGSQANFDFSSLSPIKEDILDVRSGDKYGVGHFKVRNSTGQIEALLCIRNYYLDRVLVTGGTFSGSEPNQWCRDNGSILGTFKGFRDDKDVQRADESPGEENH